MSKHDPTEDELIRQEERRRKAAATFDPAKTPPPGPRPFPIRRDPFGEPILGPIQQEIRRVHGEVMKRRAGARGMGRPKR